MALSGAQKRANEKWMKENCEFIKVRLRKGEKEIIKAKAEAEGLSMNTYIISKLLNRRYEMIYTADRETGAFIDIVGSVAEGLELIASYEAQDKADGTYEENFYDLVNEEHESIMI